MTVITYSFTQPNPATLASVQEAFTRWRIQRKGREKIPSELWNLVRQIMGRYKKTQIMNRLSINSAQLKKAGLSARAPKRKNNDNPFVNIELSKLLPTNQTNASSPHLVQLILECESNRRLIINNPSESQTAFIIQQFWG